MKKRGGSSENEACPPSNRGVETVAVNLCMIERKCGKKAIEELITSMRRDDFNLNDFLRQMRNLDDCKNICQSTLTRSLSAFQFEEKTDQTGDRKFSTKIYVRNAAELLKRKIEHADNSCFYVRSVRKVDKDGQRRFSHFVETEFARRLEEEHCKKVKSHASLNVMWMKREDTGRDSFVGFLQLYSDKSKTTLKRTGVSAYTIHMNMLNFSYEGWKREIL